LVDSAFGGKSEVRDEAQAKELEWEIEDGSTATANREEKTRGLRSDPTQVTTIVATSNSSKTKTT